LNISGKSRFSLLFTLAFKVERLAAAIFHGRKQPEILGTAGPKADQTAMS
jgi:hypothetical protein